MLDDFFCNWKWQRIHCIAIALCVLVVCDLRV
jgi:hypothetical protein